MLLVADGILYEVRGHALHLAGGEPGGRLVSVAADPSGKRIFTSDGDRIFRADKNGAVVLIGGLGGTLRWYGGGLLVLDPQRRLLVRLVASDGGK